MPNADFTELLRNCQRGERVSLPSGACAGYLLQGCFYKALNRSQHFLHSPPAVAIDESIYRASIEPACERIVVLEREKEDVLEVSVATFTQHCFRLNRGHGTQLGLGLKWWTKRNGYRQLSFSEAGLW